MQTVNEEKQHAHALVERLDAAQVLTAVRFLEFMLLDPVSRALATASFDDAPLSDAGRRAIAESDQWLQHHKPISHQEVLAGFGLTLKDFDKLGIAPSGAKTSAKTRPRRNG